LTGTLTITVRKFFVLVLSVLLFKNDFTVTHWLGASLVLMGSILYTIYSSRASQAAAVKAKEEKTANKKRD
jgi:UDP-xylose/UDP-N-acetylglucosamine transporter B4